jgi:uncharacterized protein
MEDHELVERQLGRPPRAFSRVVVRCPFGRPAITEQSPYDRSGDPFPTTYYVTCRHLVAAISRLEAAGGVERWTEEARRDPTLAESLASAHEEQRRVRAELAGAETGRDEGASLTLGIGGSANPEQLKCLHAHVAFALARPGYELGQRIAAEIDPLWPEKCCLEDDGAAL